MNLKGNLLDLSEPAVMGILNVTPDSFFDGGAWQEEDKILERAGQMLSEGARIIDIGGYSSRPGADDISEEEELKRVIPAIQAVKKKYPDVRISVDTFRSEVAEAALSEGACMVNDISAGELDNRMFNLIAEWQVPYVIMHMRGTPQTMKKLTDYKNVTLEVLDYFQKKIFILKQLGVRDIIIDPGFGFAKTMDQNYEILKNLNYFKSLNLPLLAGVSRKSMIWKKLETDAAGALNGTSVLNTIALTGGADILRVHDVKAAAEAIKLYKATYH
ncbi:MAG: dihydropteroate synthase [Cytophagaceae bacterium]